MGRGGCRYVGRARDLVVGQRITINGLSVVRPGFSVFGSCDSPSGDTIHAHYEESVIGGPSAFAIAVNDFKDFGAAIRRKLILEIAGQPLRFAWLDLEDQ